MCVDRETVVMQEFMSRDGRVIAGYRAHPGVVGFPAWIRLSDMVTEDLRAVTALVNL